MEFIFGCITRVSVSGDGESTLGGRGLVHYVLYSPFCGDFR
jgi:hypothetical protein